MHNYSSLSQFQLLILSICLAALILMLTTAYAAPLEVIYINICFFSIYFKLNSTTKQSSAPGAESDDLSTADSIGVGYYVPTISSYYSPSYYGGYGYGGYGGYGYGGYRSYGRYYRRPIYPVWG